MRHGIAFSIVVSVILCTPALAYDWSTNPGDGSEPNPYQISTPEQLMSIGSDINLLDKHYILMNDINLSGYVFEDSLIAQDIQVDRRFNGSPFRGNFNGKGHTINHLTIHAAEKEFVGLFGLIAGDAVVKNLSLRNVDITVSGSEISTIGGLCGENDAIISRCSVSGRIEGANRVGGICGTNAGLIKDCYASCHLVCPGIISGVGGICAANIFVAYAYDSYFGWGYIERCYSSCSIESSGTKKGGVVGYFMGSVKDCYWDTTVSGPMEAYYYWDPMYAGPMENVQGYTTAEMKQQASFVNWDFVGQDTDGENETWRMCNDDIDYPRLSCEFTQNGDFACPDGVGIEDIEKLSQCWLADVDFVTELDDDGDAIVSLSELARLGQYWMHSDCRSCGGIDVTGDGSVNQDDLVEIINDWLRQTYPACIVCDADSDNKITLNDYAVLARHFMMPFDVSQDVVSFFAYKNGPNPHEQTVTLINSNTEILDWSINPTGLPAWLTITPTSGSLDPNETEDITVSVEIAGLAGGKYHCPIVIYDPVSDLSLTIGVNLTVIGSNMLVSETNVDFEGFEAGDNPSDQTFEIENNGGDTLNWNIDTTDKPDWLTITPTGGSLEKDTFETVTLSADTTGLSGGQYHYTLEIADPNASNSPQVVTVELNIIGPEIFVSKSNINFEGREDGSSPSSRTFAVYNTGGGTLEWSIDTIDKPDWLSVTPITGAFAQNAYEVVTLSPNTAGLSAGQYSYALEIIDPNAFNSPQMVTVNLDVIGPEIHISRETFAFSGLEDGSNPEDKMLEIVNTGGGTLSWSIDDAQFPGWLTVSPLSGNLTHNSIEDLTLSIDVSGLSAGFYSHTFEVVDSNASNNPQTIMVELDVIGPEITISPTNIYVHGYEPNSNPIDQSFSITNTAGGTLNWTIDNGQIPSWLSISPDSGNLLNTESEDVTFSFDVRGLSVGLHSTTIEIIDPNASNNPQVLTVDLAVGSDSLTVPNDFTTIQMGLDAVTEGGIVTVSPGTYYENIQFNGKNCILTSSDPNNNSIVESTVIDGSASGHVITFNGTETPNCILRGFTIINGSAGYSNGGGIHGSKIQADGTLATIDHCIVKNCTSSVNSGGGIYNCDGNIINCTVMNNSAKEDGGGLFRCDGSLINCTVTGNTAQENGGGLADCSIVIDNCTINNNNAGIDGGGLFESGGTITNSEISYNTAADAGGGLGGHIDYWSIISDCSISNNTADYGGGLFACGGTVINCDIVYNTARKSGGGGHQPADRIHGCNISNNTALDGRGGGVYLPARILNSVISNNYASEDGGGIYIGLSNRLFMNCTIASNSTDMNGGGIANSNSSLYTIVKNCIVWENHAHLDGEQLYLPYSLGLVDNCIQDWTGGGQGIITSDPNFVDTSSPNPADWDLRLTPGSGCIDSGVYEYGSYELPTTDLDGNPRVVDGDGDGTATVDMGAYEYQP